MTVQGREAPGGGQAAAQLRPQARQLSLRRGRAQRLPDGSTAGAKERDAQALIRPARGRRRPLEGGGH